MNNYCYLFPNLYDIDKKQVKSLINQYKEVRLKLEHASKILSIDLSKEWEQNKDINDEVLVITALCIYIGIFEFIQRDCNLSKFFLYGISFGEITALVCSGALRFVDSIEIIQKISKLKQSEKNEISIRKIINQYEFSRFNIPVISNDGFELYNDDNEIYDRLVNTVLSDTSLNSDKLLSILKSNQIETIISIQAEYFIKDLINQDNTFEFWSDDNKSKLKEIKNRYLPKKNTLLFISRTLGLAVSLKNNYYEDNEAYVKGVIEPYKEVRQIEKFLERKKMLPDENQIETAINMLFSIFKTKKVPLENQKKDLYSILEETGTKNLLKNKIDSMW